MCNLDTSTDVISGAASLVRALQGEGVDTVFGTVGHGNLAFVDALIDSPIRYVPVVHEQIGAHAADAYFRASGRIAVVTTTVGPGFTNLATGLGDALLDSSALVVIAGGVPSLFIGREPLQELSLFADDQQPELFRPLAKRVIKVHRPADLVSSFREAVRRALSGCPGPTILHVPMDFFSAPVPGEVQYFRSFEPTRPDVDPRMAAEAAKLIAAAERPLLYAGNGVILSTASHAITHFAEEFGLPVATTMSGQGAIAEDHPMSLGFTGVVGTRPANYAARHADLLIAIGTRFAEMDTSSWRTDSFTAIPPARLIHVDIDELQVDKTYPADIKLIGDATKAVDSLACCLRSSELSGPVRWADWRGQLGKIAADWQDEVRLVRSDPSFPYQPARLLTELRAAVPRETMIVTGVGIRHAVGQHFPFFTERSQIVASGFGTMGQEMAAPIGAKLGRSGSPVVALVGDGAFMACSGAIPTAVMSEIHAIWVVLNNGGYGSIAVYQNRHFGRYLGTRFEQHSGKPYEVSYAEVARSFGARTATIQGAGELTQVMREALAEPAVWVIEVPVTPAARALASGHWDVNDILGGSADVSKAGQDRWARTGRRQ